MLKATDQKITLHINGEKLEHFGWSKLSVMRSIHSIASAFSFTYADRWSETGRRFPIRSGDACTVRLGDKLVLSGYVDKCSREYSATTHTLTAAGRSKAGDLVECSVEGGASQWTAVSILPLAQEVCKPFGINVTAEAGIDLGQPFDFSVQECEKVYEFLERALKPLGLLIMSTASGDLVIGASGKQRVSHTLLASEVLSGGLEDSWHERHSIYVVKTHMKPENSSKVSPLAAITATDSAMDLAVKRYRPLTVLVENPTTLENIEKRAQWEANTRAARSKVYKYVVPGWGYATDALWVPNKLVHVTDLDCDLDNELLIVAVTYARDESKGTTTTLELMAPDSYSLTPITAKDKTHSGKFGPVGKIRNADGTPVRR